MWLARVRFASRSRQRPPVSQAWRSAATLAAVSRRKEQNRARWVLECDSFRFCLNLSYGWRFQGRAFSGVSWLYCRPEFGYQAPPSVTLPPYFARREPAARRRSVAMGRERKNKG